MKIFAEKNIDCLFITSEHNRVWFSDYPSSAGFMFVRPWLITYFLDSRYYTEAVEKTKGMDKFEIVLYKSMDQLVKFVNSSNIRRVGFEDAYMTAAELENFRRNFLGVEFVPIGGPNIRNEKFPYEVTRVEKAIDISLQALYNIREEIRPGVTERYIDILLNAEMKRLGAEKEAFDSIIASGWRGAIPHGRASDKVIEPGEWITIDFGAKYRNYCADITRTFKLPGYHKDDEVMSRIFEIVKEAQRRGIEAIRPGIQCKEIDRICREYIASFGYGEYFGHGTGHGLGIEIHEEPYVSPLTKNGVLEVGNIVTVEPGIYIPGVGGVRLEDDILVTENGFRQLGKNIDLIQRSFYDKR